jgi:hypothetical protein
MSFLAPSLLQKKTLGLSNFTQCFSFHVFQWSFVWKNMEYRTFTTLMPTTSLIYFLGSFNIIFNNFNIWCFGAPYCLEKKKPISNPICIVFLTCLFNIPAIAYCYYHSPSFIILGIFGVHFFFWPNLSHSWTKIMHQLKFWIGMFKFGNIC